ncbi:hypothetical protein [Streptomyces sp. NBC_01803]|uniref:hypothetical protein n=1 Tax=Streptomyces sp. NBC_01803 TaxID=2975946 RepID=UPI002DDB7A5D|nr:hypothetical protein [Streptomyces sp. NBC_01803]WSA46027.1 hypothetical protein OIE51_18565 [Streptomyces sp. NBC_01803]
MVTAFDLALIEESAKKSSLVWVRGSEGVARGLWHVWHDGAVCLVGGPGEQPFDGLGLADGGPATVSCRSKDKGGRLIVWPALVAEPTPDGEVWRAAVNELRGKRLNAPETAEALAARWATECRVLRLTPSGEPLQRPDTMPTASPAAAPPPTPASTRLPVPSGLPARRRPGRSRQR